MTMIMCEYVVSRANGNLVSSPRGATRSGSFRASSDVCVCHLELTTRTGGGVQGKTCILLHLFQVTIAEGETGIIGWYATVTFRQMCVMMCILPCHLSYIHIT